MWSPAPTSKVIRRPAPLDTFNHQRRKLVKRKNPLEFRPENHYGYRYFGIRHSDITDYLEKQVPSHAFAPAKIITGHGRGKIGEQARPSSAPAAVPWFGRASSDVSDWLRQVPPAHLGLDPNDKPLPYFPSKSSIVTDNRWQTRDFPPVPNVLWHYWADRPSSAPLATNPQQVKLDTLLDAIKNNRPKPRLNSLNPLVGAQSGPNTPSPVSGRSNAESPAETPRVQETHRTAENDKGPSHSVPPLCGNSVAGVKQPGTPRLGTSRCAVKAPETPRQCSQCGKRHEAFGSSKGRGNGRDVDANGSNSCKNCACGKGQDTPRSPTLKSHESSPRSPKRPETPETAEKVGTNKAATEPCQRNGRNTPMSSAGTPRLLATTESCKGNGCNIQRSGLGSSVETPRTQTPKIFGEKKPAYASQRPPPSRTTAKQRADPRSCARTPPVPFHEVIRNSRKAPELQDHSTKANGKENGNGEAATADELRLMSPDTYATKAVWQDNFRKVNKGNPWLITVH